jgi:ribosomal protein L11 methyltransferase
LESNNTLNWIEISVAVDAETAEAVSALFEQYGEGGAVMEEMPVDPSPTVLGPRPFRCVAKAFLPAGETARLEALQEALWHLRQIKPFGDTQVRELGYKDWAEAWKSGYQVLRLGQKLRIVPSWIPYEAQPGEVIITLDPGMAFGTGLHPSTQLCLQALEELIRPGMRILDVGTGSGILAIAAAKLGAAEVLAVDIEGVSVRTARENVRINGVEQIVRVEQGSVDDVFRGEYDGVLANILAEIIARLAPDLARHMKPDAWLVTSGIIVPRVVAVERAYDVAGLDITRRWQVEDWLALEAHRR